MQFFEETLSQENIYSGRVFDVHRDRVRLHDGQETIREVIEHPGGISIAALDEANNIYFVEQFRYPFSTEMIEVPAGRLEPGEEPLAAAKRELLEETGLTAKRWEKVGTFLSSPGFCGETLHFYLATELTQGKQCPDDGEFLRVLTMPLEEAITLVEEDRILDGKTKALVLLAERRLRQMKTNGIGKGEE